MNMLSKEIRIGMIILSGFIILVLGVKYLKGMELFAKGSYYYVVYDKVDGLNQGSPVVFRGFKVGSVRKIGLHPTCKNKILVTCLLTEEVYLAKDTKAQIYGTDLLGAKGINLLEGKSSQILLPDDTLQHAYEPTLKEQFDVEVGPLKAKMELVMQRVDTLLMFTNSFVNPKNENGISDGLKNFNASMTNLQQITASLNSQLKSGGSLNNSFKNLDTISTTISSNSGSIRNIISNLDSTLEALNRAKLEETILQLRAVLAKSEAVVDSINSSNGSLGLLINDKALYYSLLSSSENLDRLLVDVRQNPKRYVKFTAMDFGKNVYLSPKADSTSVDGSVSFFVEISKSKEPLSLKSQEIDSFIVQERFYDKEYHYLVAKSRTFNEVKSHYEALIKAYPSSEIVAFRNEKPISLKKAMNFVDK